MVIDSKRWDPYKEKRQTWDTRTMGDAIKHVHFPIPASEHKFLGYDRFLVIDMNNAFIQMELDEESSQLFVFTMPFRLYKFKRLVKGIFPALAKCHEALRRIFKGIEGVVQIKDGLVIHGHD